MAGDGWPVLGTVNPSMLTTQADCTHAISAKIFVSNFGTSIKMMCDARPKHTQGLPSVFVSSEIAELLIEDNNDL